MQPRPQRPWAWFVEPLDATGRNHAGEYIWTATRKPIPRKARVLTVNREIAEYVRRRHKAGARRVDIARYAHLDGAVVDAVLDDKANVTDEWGRITWRSPVTMWPITDPELRATAGRLVSGRLMRNETPEWRRWVVWCNFVSFRFYRPTDAPSRV